MTTELEQTAAPESMVYVIDDDQSVRVAVEDLIQSVGLSVLSFKSVQAFLATPRHDVPSCLVLDVRMPGQSGTDFHRQMASYGFNIPTIFITGHGDIAMGVQAIKNGAIEFLTKPFRDQDLLDAMQRAIETDRERRRQRAITADLRKRFGCLTPGEQEVMMLVVHGSLNKQIAAALHVSEITVKVRRSHVMRKMRAKTLADLVRLSDRLCRE